MNEKTETKTEMVRIRMSKAEKRKIIKAFGSLSAIRDYALKAIESKGENVRLEVKK